MACCEMRGFLSFTVLWIVYKQGGTGADITREIERRRGSKPSPGTIYPVLKDLKEKGMVTNDDDRYIITCEGKKELAQLCKTFKEMFYDMDEICTCKELDAS